jgi:hypothetical protein
MSYDIRRLDPITDSALFEAAYNWLVDSPQWRKDTEAVFGTLDREEYLAATHAPHRIDIGVFEDGELTALVTLTLVGHSTYEVHFEASRGASAKTVVAAGWEIRDQMFRYGMQCAYTWTPHWNRRVLAINKAIGFQPDNVSMWRGSIGDRTIEWVRYSLTNPLCRAA